MKRRITMLVSSAILITAANGICQERVARGDESVFAALEEVHMSDRLFWHYEGGDIGEYLSQSQFVWSDRAIVLAWNDFGPFVRFFDAVRAAAHDKDLTRHSRIDNWEIASIFHQAFPTEDVFGDDQFGDPEFRPLPVDKFYEIIETYRGRAPTSPKGEQAEALKP